MTVANDRHLPARHTKGQSKVSKKTSGHLPYDVSGGGGSTPILLSTREVNQLKTALGSHPSALFMQILAFGLGSYVEHRRLIAEATPQQVMERLSKVLDHGVALREALSQLKATDRNYVGEFWTKRFLSGEKACSENELLKALNLFLADVSDTVKELGAAQRKGTMPGYAKQSLAQTIAQALFRESGKFPPLTKGKTFDRVLKFALDTANKRLDKVSKPVSDVMDLMRFAKETFDENAAKKLGEMFMEGEAKN
jgi:hypothetical protein